MDKEPLNAGLFNYAAQQLGYAAYEWKDAGQKGFLEAGEFFQNEKGVDLTNPVVQGDVEKIRTKATALMKSHLVFSPASAIPHWRIYQKRFKTKAKVGSVPSTDKLYARLKPYLEIPAHSCREGKMAKKFKQDLEALGFQVHQDQAFQKIKCKGDFTGGKEIQAETGNVIGYLKGDPGLPSWHLSVHLDGTTPQITPVPHVREGDILKTTGDSILRGDDVAGIVLGLEFVGYLQKHNIPHGDIYFSGLVAEETGADGAKHIAEKDLQGDIGLVLDGYESEVVYGGSDIWIWNLKVRGKAEHVSLAPQVVNAQVVASYIISGAWGLNEGSSYRGDPNTVVVATSFQSGQGYQEGGEEKVRTSNSVPDLAILSGQIRTKEANSRETVIGKMEGDVERLCQKMGARCEFSAELALPGFQDPASMTLEMVRQGYRRAGLEQPPFTISHGGSNANFTFPKRGEQVMMPIGGSRYHTTQERLNLRKMCISLQSMVGIAIEAAQYRRVSK